MANYLVGSGAGGGSLNLGLNLGGLPPSREDTLHVDNMYRIKIYNSANTIAFSGYVPEDFNFSLASNWSAPFEGISLTDAPDPDVVAVGRALKFGGLSSQHKLLTARVWDSPGYFTLELPIFLDAYRDTEIEVMRPMVQLLSMAAADESYSGFLIPPGPVPAIEVLNATTSLISGRQDPTAGGGQFDSKEAFTVQLGKFFKMSPAIITNVSASGDSAFEDETGNPISADFMLTIESYFAVTRRDLAQWFGTGDVLGSKFDNMFGTGL